MKTLLIITHMDYQYFANTRTHHIVEEFQHRCDKITIIHRTHTAAEALQDLLRSFCKLTIKQHQTGNISLIRVAPMFNPSSGMGLRVLGIANPYTIPASLVKRILRKTVGFLGFILEFTIFPSFTIAYLLKDRGTYDVVIGEGIWAIALGYVLKKTKRTSLLVVDDYDYSPGNQPIMQFRRWYTEKIEVFLLRRADLIISVGELLGKRREKQTEKRVEVISNGVDYELFQASQEKLRHPPTLVYSGAVEAWSGLDIIIEALPKVKESIPHMRFLIIGHADPLYERQLRALIRARSLDRDVFYLGVKPYNELPLYLKEADLGMALYMPIELRKYAFSLKIIEYMAAGLPVITIKDTQSEDIVRKHSCGIAVDYEPEAVAEAIRMIMQDQNLYRQFSENAKKAAPAYAWKSLMEKYYGLLSERIMEQEA